MYTVYSPTPSYHSRCENGASADQPTTPWSSSSTHTGARSPRAASHRVRSSPPCGPAANVATPLAMASS